MMYFIIIFFCIFFLIFSFYCYKKEKRKHELLLTLINKNSGITRKELEIKELLLNDFLKNYERN